MANTPCSLETYSTIAAPKSAPILGSIRGQKFAVVRHPVCDFSDFLENRSKFARVRGFQQA
jgi:hypothetical protein